MANKINLNDIPNDTPDTDFSTQAAALHASGGMPDDFWRDAKTYNGVMHLLSGTKYAPRHVPYTVLDLATEGVQYANELCQYRWDDLTDPEARLRIRNHVVSIATDMAEDVNQNRRKSMQIDMRAGSVPLETGCAIIVGTGDVANVLVMDNANDEDARPTLCYYSSTGEYAGTWTPITGANSGIVLDLLVSMGVKFSSTNKVLQLLEAIAPTIKAKRNPHLYPFHNGLLEILDGGGRMFTPYLTDEGAENPQYADLYGREAGICGKIRANYNPGMAEPVFTCSDGFIWRPLDHIRQATDGNPHAFRFLIQATLFAMRGMSGGRCIWFMDGSQNQDGGGGKSTTGDMISGVVGSRYTANLKMEDVAKPFGLAPVVGAFLIMGHETSAGQKTIEDCENVKLLMRNEPVQVEEKYRQGYPYRFTGLWIQAMNSKSPRLLDNTNSTYRRVVPIYFPNKYAGRPHDEIRDNFCHTQECADFLANYALDTFGDLQKYDEEDVAALREKIADIKAAGSTSCSFLDEYMYEERNKSIPISVLFAFYRVWCEANGNRGVAAAAFRDEVGQWCSLHGGWRVESTSNARYKSDEWILSRWMTDNPVKEFIMEPTHGQYVMTASMTGRRDRHMLIKDETVKGAVSIDKAPEKTIGDEIDAHTERGMYSAYVASVLYAMHANEAAFHGISTAEAILPPDVWKQCDRMEPRYEWDIVGWRPAGTSGIALDAYGYAAGIVLARSDASVVSSMYNWQRAVMASGDANAIDY